MNIVAISDMHGQLDFTVPTGDLLCICGDIVPLYIQTDMLKSLEWFRQVFLEWCNNQPVKKIYFIAGNHDFFLEYYDPEIIKNYCAKITNYKVEYLFDESMQFETYKIYGTPWCHQFGSWAFMKPDEMLSKRFEKIPENVDILLTHDAPYGRTDLLMQGAYYFNKGHLGNKPLLKRLEKVKPRINFTGHLHSCNHVPENFDGTTTVCVSLLDENYEMNYKPFEIVI